MAKFQKGDRRNALNKLPICHPDRAYYAKDLCVQCYRLKYNPKYYKENKDVMIELQVEYAKNNKEKKRKAVRKYTLWQYFRLTPEEWETILKYQGGVCAISGKPPVTRALAADHDHKTGKVRGALSLNINRGLAYFSDDPVLLRKAADYLENPPASRALGKEVFGLIGKAKKKKTMIYGSPNGPIKALKKVRKKK
jgi:Recombination endonuclease VII